MKVNIFRNFMLVGWFVCLVISGCENHVSPWPQMNPGTTKVLGRLEHPDYLQMIYCIKEKAIGLGKSKAYLTEQINKIREGDGWKQYVHDSDRYIVIVLFNMETHKGISTYASSYVVGAIFDVRDVKDQSIRAKDLVDRVNLDADPICLDGVTQRWLIIDRDIKQRRIQRP